MLRQLHERMPRDEAADTVMQLYNVSSEKGLRGVADCYKAYTGCVQGWRTLALKVPTTVHTR